MTQKKPLKSFLKKNLWLICFLFLWLVFSLGATSLDPDFGWHFKTGEWIWQNKSVPRHDIFSYTMPDYPWQVHSWFSEVVLYRLFLSIGWSGLAALAGLIITLALTLPIKKKKIEFAIGPLLLAGLSIWGFNSVRPRIASLFLAAILFSILKKSYQKDKILFLLPGLFLVWANLHGGFSFGLTALLAVAGIDLFLVFQGRQKLKSRLKIFLPVIFLSFLATLVNPYGISIYREIINEMIFGQKAHLKIAEWLPYSTFNPAMIFYTGFFLSLVFYFKKKLPLWEKVFLSFLLLIALLSRRFLAYFFLFSLPIFVSLLGDFYNLVFKTENFLKLVRFRFWFWLVFFLFVVFSFGWYLKPNFSEGNDFYPKGAVSFLRERDLPARLYSIYNWGGYLIWQLPEEKVFVDGRMAIWQKNHYSAFEEETKIRLGEIDFEPIFEKYAVSTVLLPANETELAEKGHFIPLDRRLVEAGWEVVYKDGTAQVLEKKIQLWPKTN